MGPDNGGPGGGADLRGFSIHTRWFISIHTQSHWPLGGLPRLTVSLMILMRPALQDPVLRTEREIFKLRSCEQEEQEGNCRQVGYKPKIKTIPTTNKLLGPPLQARGLRGYEGATFSCHAVWSYSHSAAAHMCTYYLTLYKAVSHTVPHLTLTMIMWKKEDGSCYYHFIYE